MLIYRDFFFTDVPPIFSSDKDFDIKDCNVFAISSYNGFVKLSSSGISPNLFGV